MKQCTHPFQQPDLEKRFWYKTKCQTCGNVNEKAEDSSLGWKMYVGPNRTVLYTCPTCPVLPGAQNAFER